MEKPDGTFSCDACGRDIRPAGPNEPIVPYMILGGALGDERWVACSDQCKNELVIRYHAIMNEGE